MKKHWVTAVYILIVIIGVLIFSYPIVSNYWNSMHQSEVIGSYEEQRLALPDTEAMKALADARAYNDNMILAPKSTFLNGEPVDKQYESLLNIGDSGIIGVIEIPKIEVNLPIYHGSAESVLAIGVGHLEGSSLPVGGASTHTVLTGHRGLPSALLFSNLDQLVIGDYFKITVLKEVLTYEVDQIVIVEPQEVDEMSIQADEDLCTLVTCTPYGINSHRMLVRGHRIATEEVEGVINESYLINTEATRIQPYIVTIALALPVLGFLLLLVVFVPTKKERNSYNIIRKI